MPHVSVIIPSFNCASWISLAIESVYAQTYHDFELLVVDDGSTDDTSSVIEPYRARPDFQYILQTNGGPSSARNTGAGAAKGEYLVFLDADDEFEGNALEIMVREIERHNAAWIVTDVLKLTDEGTEHYVSAVPDADFFGGILRRDFVQWGYFYRRDDFFEVGLFDEAMRIREDWDINIRMLEHDKQFVYIPSPLYRYRRRETSAMTSSTRDRILGCTRFLLRKHHKRLADAGDRRVATIYARQLCKIARRYLFKAGKPFKAAACLAESMRYDPLLLPAIVGSRLRRWVMHSR